MLALALELPDPVVRLPTQIPDAVGQRFDHVPEFGRDEAALALINGHAVDHRAEDVELPLAGGAVADANRPSAFEARQVLEVLLGQVRVAIHPVEDLHREVMVVGTIPDPVDEVHRLLLEAGAKERRDAIGRVAEPAVAVIPIAIAARILRDRRGWRGQQGTGRRVGEQLDHQRGSPNGILKWSLIEALLEPADPEGARPLGEFGGIAAAGKFPAEGEVALAEAECQPHLRAGLDGEAEHVARSSIDHLDVAVERHGGGEDHFLRPARGDHDALAVGKADARATVGRRGVQDAFDLHRSAARLEAAANPLQRKKALALDEAGHEIGHDQRPFGAMEGGGQDVGVADVGLLTSRHRVDRRNPETAAALPVENRREDGGRVEARIAKPVDRAAGRDQGGGFTITDQSVRIHSFTQIRTWRTPRTYENGESNRTNVVRR